jgi:hypothetical protein
MARAKKMARGEKFQFVGYYNCLNFVNTEFTKEGGRRIDSLRSFADLINWLCESRLFNRKQLELAMKSWGSEHAAERIFQYALALRRALLAIAESLRTLSTPPRCRLANRFYTSARPALFLSELRQSAGHHGY